MAKLGDLGLSNEAVGQALDYAEMGEQMGTFADPPQPGDYRFRLPGDLSAVWETFDYQNGVKPGPRVRAKFDSTNPLIIVKSPGDARTGEPFQTSITNAERKRGKKDDATAPYISDMDYMNRDVWGLTGKPGNGSNLAYAQEFMKHGGAEFTAEVTWNWFCNDKKPIFVDNGSGGFTQMEGQNGCGTSYYQRDIPKVPADPNDPSKGQHYPLRITCGSCGANIRAFANLGNFRK
jgi:hypothetical protein